jgi:hypothetical protein
LLLLLLRAAQDGKRTAFAMLEDCQRLAAAGSSTANSSRLLLGLQEPVLNVQPLADGSGVEVTTQKRRYGHVAGTLVCLWCYASRLVLLVFHLQLYSCCLMRLQSSQKNHKSPSCSSCLAAAA